MTPLRSATPSRYQLRLRAMTRRQRPDVFRRRMTEVIFCVRGVISPILSNIYLDKLDQFVVQSLLPRYTRGNRRRPNPVWQRLQREARKLRKLGNHDEAKRLRL